MNNLLKVVASTDEQRGMLGEWDIFISENLTLNEGQELIKDNIGRYSGGILMECMSN